MTARWSAAAELARMNAAATAPATGWRDTKGNPVPAPVVGKVYRVHRLAQPLFEGRCVAVHGAWGHFKITRGYMNSERGVGDLAKVRDNQCKIAEVE
jgi:hypothetical protein